jgi:hypothetical protein
MQLLASLALDVLGRAQLVLGTVRNNGGSLQYMFLLEVLLLLEQQCCVISMSPFRSNDTCGTPSI